MIVCSSEHESEKNIIVSAISVTTIVRSSNYRILSYQNSEQLKSLFMLVMDWDPKGLTGGQVFRRPFSSRPTQLKMNEQLHVIILDIK